MKVMNITNLDTFWKMIDQCEGKIELITKSGDKYNLKSKISQYVALTKTVFGGRISELELITHNPKDINRIIRYMINNE